LLSPSEDRSSSFVALAVDSTKFTQTAYAASEINQEHQIPLEAAAALAELLSARMQNFEAVGKIIVAEIDPKVDLYDWLTIDPACQIWKLDRFGFRALTSVFRAVLRCTSVGIEEKDGVSVISPDGQRLNMTNAAMSVLRRVAFWTNVEIAGLGDDSISVAIR
jgi:hypothetical protein